MFQCPDCDKNYKRKFWFRNHLMIKHRQFNLYTFILDILIFGLFFGVIIPGSFHYGFFDKITGLEQPPTKIDETQLDEFGKRLISEFINADVSINKECVSNITEFKIEKKDFNFYAELYDGCDVKKLEESKSPFYETSLMSYLVYPLWDINKTHYIIDLYADDSRKNRISLFMERGYLVGKFYDSKGAAYEIPLPIKNKWKNKEWGIIILQSNELTQEISISVYNLETKELFFNTLKVNNYDIDLKKINGYIGSDMFGKNQAYAVISNFPGDNLNNACIDFLKENL